MKEKYKKITSLCIYLSKYLYSTVLLALLLSVGLIGKKATVFALTELLIIAFITELIAVHSKMVAYIANSVILFAGNIQHIVLFYGSSYISLQMLSNLGNLADLSGNFHIYAIAIACVLIFSFLPVSALGIKKSFLYVSGGCGILMFLISVFMGGWVRWSPYYAWYDLANNAIAYNQLKQVSQTDKHAISFYRGGVTHNSSSENYFSALETQPNIILIFTEGLSEHIIHDERGIMRNALALEHRSISFENYYNHTFATYMGLNGQLYSGYQRSNLDKNGLPSLQGILHNAGYYTVFFNTEPCFDEFTQYLVNMHFDELRTDEKNHKGLLNSVSDADTYNNILSIALELNESDEPFFLACYTFGTHASFDSTDEKFGDGTDKLLNKFYNADYQLGKFLAEFEDSKLFDNTLFIFTADHCTYEDADFRQSFPAYERVSWGCDRIPLFFYYKDCVPSRIDVGGRNSLCLAPTLLDLLCVSDENFFLGNSLFGSPSEYDSLFCSLTTYYHTSELGISPLNKEATRTFIKKLRAYYNLCLYTSNEN